MPAKKQRTHLHTVGEEPNVGRRYVSDGKVRIEWREGGKRRSRTVGPNTPKVRAEADAMLADLVRSKRPATKARTTPAAPAERQLPPGDDVAASIGDAARAWAVALMDVADVLVERAESWLTQWTKPTETAESDDD